jgi:hypothetical protein
MVRPQDGPCGREITQYCAQITHCRS